MTPTFVIAEPGCTHEGSLDTMQRLIDAAHAAKCDAFKNQWLGDPDEVRRRRRSDYASYDWLHYPVEWHAICREYCHSLGMQYGCSTNLADDLRHVNRYVDFHKRPSFENNDQDWLSAAKMTGRRFFVSAGMLDHEDLIRLIDAVDPWGEILHCTSSYPAPLESLNLGVIRQYSLDGLSDHSREMFTGAIATCLGANVIEAHLRLDDTSPINPDYATALTPSQFRQYVAGIRAVEDIIGDGVKRIEPAEQSMLRYKVGA